MSAEDVANALRGMEDSDVASRLAAGDFADLSGNELTDAEQAMVIAAAQDLPEVEGFYLKYKLEAFVDASGPIVEESVNLQAAIDHVRMAGIEFP